MTNERAELLAVTPDDRQMAVLYGRLGDLDCARAILAGENDGHCAVQAFARHRLAALTPDAPPDREAIARIVAPVAWGDRDRRALSGKRDVLERVACDQSLRVADAILALLPTTPAPVSDGALREAKALVVQLKRDLVDSAYMTRALVQMLGPNALAVWKLWQDKGVIRVYHDWMPKAADMTGEERAAHLLEWEAAPKRLIEDVDAALSTSAPVLDQGNQGDRP